MHICNPSTIPCGTLPDGLWTISIRKQIQVFFFTRSEIFEFRLELDKPSFLRKQESSLFKTFWIPASVGMTMRGYF